MSNKTTPRFQLPYPGDTAESWWDVFDDFATAVDSTMLSLMEANAWTFLALPSATIESDGGTGYQLRLLADCVMASRTYQAHLTIDSDVVLALTPQWLVVVRVPSGAVASATVALELWQNGVPVNPDYRVLGHINADYSITWWNASVLSVGDTLRLFTQVATMADDALWARGLSSDGGTTNNSTAVQVYTHRTDASIHRVINDGTVTTTSLWSSDKINTMLAGAGIRRPFVLDILDPTAAPPGSPTVGDRYILDYSASPVNAGWGVGAAVNDIVQYTATGWTHEHAVEGWRAYERADLVDALFVNDGHWQWELQFGGGPLQDAYDKGNEIIIPDGGSPVLITNNHADGHALQVGGSGLRDIYSGGALAMEAVGALALRSTGGELTLDDTRYAGGSGPVTSLPLTNSGVTDFVFPCSSLVDAINKAYTGPGAIVWSGTTATASPTEIFLGGIASTRYSLTTNGTAYFNLTCVARDNVNNDSKVWDVKAVAAVDSTGAAELVAAPTYTVVAASAGAAGWSLAATVNDPDNTFRLTVTGGGVTIQWVVSN